MVHLHFPYQKSARFVVPLCGVMPCDGHRPNDQGSHVRALMDETQPTPAAGDEQTGPNLTQKVKANLTQLCRVCGTPVPQVAGTGRAKLYCSPVCSRVEQDLRKLDKLLKMTIKFRTEPHLSAFRARLAGLSDTAHVTPDGGSPGTTSATAATKQTRAGRRPRGQEPPPAGA